MPPNNPDDSALLENLKGTSSKKLVNGVEKVDGLSPEDEEALERGGLLALRGTKRRIARLALWFFFIVGAVLVVLAMIGIVWLCYKYLIEIAAAGKVGEAVTGILTFLAGVFSTLAVEFMWHLSTRGKSDSSKN